MSHTFALDAEEKLSTPKMEFFTQSEENGHNLSNTGFTFVLGQLEQKLWQFEHYFA